MFSRISQQGPTSRGLHPDAQEPEPHHLEAPVDVRTEPETRNPETRRPEKAQPALTVQEDEAVASVAGRGGEEEQVQLSIQTVNLGPQKLQNQNTEMCPKQKHLKLKTSQT